MNKETQKQYRRDERGLLEGVNYIYNDDGTINWKAMIPPEFLIVQRDYEREVVARYNKDIKDIDPREIDDRYLMILLGGIKHLLRLRGYRSVKQKIDFVDHHKAVATCTIEFIPNFETDGEPQTFSDTSSASTASVSGVFRLFLESIAANRAFVRAVRNGLGINIVAKDEFDERASKEFLKNADNEGFSLNTESTGFNPSNILEKKCKNLGFSFEVVKKSAIDNYTKQEMKFSVNPETWTDFSSIQHSDAYILLSKIEEKKSKK